MLTIISIVSMWAFARIFLDHGFPYSVVAGSSLISELARPKTRARLGSLFCARSCYFINVIFRAGPGWAVAHIELKQMEHGIKLESESRKRSWAPGPESLSASHDAGRIRSAPLACFLSTQDESLLKRTK
ncbi:hypothetical protein BDW02DRAFT_106098 [Decorospora gaudefroyi]|uniref:Uncharacterized protein n=1 Tax=Decorospora gaudefroyi TaxID=184978 RepID=A0A6A5K743_9PLEO|nr:hypothetical protein BDW02DRAFT_106098 [Decorospora gaudefroyi]